MNWSFNHALGRSEIRFFAWRVKLECSCALVRDCLNGVGMRFFPGKQRIDFCKTTCMSSTLSGDRVTRMCRVYDIHVWYSANTVQETYPQSRVVVSICDRNSGLEIKMLQKGSRASFRLFLWRLGGNIRSDHDEGTCSVCLSNVGM